MTGDDVIVLPHPRTPPHLTPSHPIPSHHSPPYGDSLRFDKLAWHTPPEETAARLRLWLHFMRLVNRHAGKAGVEVRIQPSDKACADDVAAEIRELAAGVQAELGPFPAGSSPLQRVFLHICFLRSSPFTIL